MDQIKETTRGCLLEVCYYSGDALIAATGGVSRSATYRREYRLLYSQFCPYRLSSSFSQLSFLLLYSFSPAHTIKPPPLPPLSRQRWTSRQSCWRENWYFGSDSGEPQLLQSPDVDIIQVRGKSLGWIDSKKLLFLIILLRLLKSQNKVIVCQTDKLTKTYGTHLVNFIN